MAGGKRTYEWQDHSPFLEAAKTKSGLELMQGILRGELPPATIAQTMNYRLVEVEEGRVLFEGGFEDYLMNPLGTLHGGWHGVLLDSAMACAVQTKLPAGVGYTTLEYKINLTRGARADVGPLRAEGWVVHFGRTTATAEGRILDRDGKVYAHGSETCLIFQPK